MKTKGLVISIASTVALGIIIMYTVRRNRLHKRLMTIADAGYETAQDVLYPLNRRRFKRI